MKKWLLASCLLALVVLVPSVSGAGELTLGLPEQVAVGDPVSIIVTGLSNSTFRIVASGPLNFDYRLNDTFRNGTYRIEITLFQEGDYYWTAFSRNETITKKLVVICDQSCQDRKLMGLYAQSDSRVWSWVGIFAALVLGVEFVRYIESHKEKREFSRLMGLPMPRNFLLDHGLGLKLFMPGSYGARRIEVNPRIAFQEEKQSVLDAIHEQTAPEHRYMAGRDYDYEHSMMEKFRTYAVADRNLTDMLEGEAQHRGKFHVEPKVSLEENLEGLVVGQNPEVHVASHAVSELDRRAKSLFEDLDREIPKPVPSLDFLRPKRSAIRIMTRAAVVIFYGLDALMLLFMYAASRGVYVDAFRPLWVPWIPDDLKWLLGILAFVPLLTYMAVLAAIRHGRRRPIS